MNSSHGSYTIELSKRQDTSCPKLLDGQSIRATVRILNQGDSFPLCASKTGTVTMGYTGWEGVPALPNMVIRRFHSENCPSVGELSSDLNAIILRREEVTFKPQFGCIVSPQMQPYDAVFHDDRCGVNNGVNAFRYTWPH
jgi:hypothetical protein